MSPEAPPTWLERILLALLPARDRDVIAGDLLEEYVLAKLPEKGRLKAEIWYLRQIISFALTGVQKETLVRQILLVISVFGFAAAVWLAVMENMLKHAGIRDGQS